MEPRCWNKPIRVAARSWAAVLILFAFVAMLGCQGENAATTKTPSDPATTTETNDPAADDAQPTTDDAASKPSEDANEAGTSDAGTKTDDADEGTASEWPSIEDMPPYEPPVPKPWNLGDPLVDDLESLARIAPEEPIWITKDRKQVVFQGLVCQRQAPLEFFVCRRDTRDHESVVSADVTPSHLQAALIAIGAEPGRPVVYHPEFESAAGEVIDINVFWKDKDGQVRKSRAQDWVYNAQTEKSMDVDWVFTGSFLVDPQYVAPGQSTFAADRSGDIITVANFREAMLDLPIESSNSNMALVFEAYTDHIPDLGTPVTIVMTPTGKRLPKSGPPELAPPTTEEAKDTEAPSTEQETPPPAE